MDFARHLLAYCHLLCFALALASVASEDALVAWRLARGDCASGPLGPRWPRARAAGLTALGGLWVSGAALLAMAWISQGSEAFASPALRAKLAVCAALSANALLLSPKLQRALGRSGGPGQLAPGPLLAAALTLSLSLSGWLYAGFLSAGGSLPWRASAWALAAAYPALCAGSFLALLAAALASKALGARALARAAPRRQERLDAQGVEAQIDANFEAMRRLSNNLPVERI